MEKLAQKVKTALESDLDRIYIPKMTTGQLSRMIMFHLINASAEFLTPIHTLTIRETAPMTFFVNINQQASITLHLKQTKP